MRRNKRHGSTSNISVFLEGYSGDSIRMDRVSRAAEYVRSPAITIGAAVQPEILRSGWTSESNRNRGLPDRFLFSIPDSQIGHRKINPRSVAQKKRQAYESKMRAILKLPWADPDDHEQPHLLTLGRPASEAFIEMEHSIEERLSCGGDLVGITGWAGKLCGVVARLAGLLHVAEKHKQLPGRNIITSDTMRKAIMLGEYFTSHAPIAFQMMSDDMITSRAEKVVRKLQEWHEPRISRREIHYRLKSTFRSLPELKPILGLLEQKHYIRTCMADEKKAGRPSVKYDVNPHLLEMVE